MSTPPPNDPWGQPQVAQQPGQGQQPTPPPAGPPPRQWPPVAPTMRQVPVARTSGGGNGKETLAMVIGIVAVVAIGVVGFLVLRGDSADEFPFDDTPADDVPADDTIEVPGTSASISDDEAVPPVSVGEEPEEIAERAIQAVIEGDCPTVLSLSTLRFIAAHSEEVCGGELLPPGANITGVETLSESPVIVGVGILAGGQSFGIELTFAEEHGTLLIDDYSV